MNNTIEDLSFSSLVDHIQGNINTAKSILLQFAEELTEVNTQIEAVEKHLHTYKTRKKELLNASHMVCEIIDRPLPLAVTNGNHIVVISDVAVTIETNVI